MLGSAVVGTFKTLDDITAADRPFVGGKAFNCPSRVSHWFHQCDLKSFER
jgi:hypothetical protein